MIKKITYIFIFVGSGLGFFGSIWGLIQEGLSIYACGGILLFGGACMLILFEKRWSRYFNIWIVKKRASIHCQIKKDHFYFPKGYYFKHSSLKKAKHLPFAIINEVRTNTHPPTVVIHSNEVIFLHGLTKEHLPPLKNRIPFTQPQDHWALICHAFLDTEHSEESKQFYLNQLASSGISETEVRKTRKKIEVQMLIRTSVTWEWLYYGQWDVMHELWPMTKNKYWWTMELALRQK